MRSTERQTIQRAVPEWNSATLATFRFCLIYLGLYILLSQISASLIVIPYVAYRGLGTLWPMREITLWAGQSVFGITEPLVFAGASRDTNFFWVQVSWLLVFAALAAAVWSALDRRREYVTLHKWFRVFVRLCVAAQMFEYGMTKLIPVQFPAPSLNTLVTPVGDLSLQSLFWASVGASTPYEIFTGSAELLAGVLLIVPRTATLGALLALVNMIHVFMLNMTYDIGVKQVSLHLIALTLFLLAPELRRLATFFFSDKAVERPTQAPLFNTARANRMSVIMQIALGVYLLSMQALANWNYWVVEGGGSPRSALYGIWNVNELSVDGEVRPVVMNDYDRRWRRVIFDDPETMVFQRIDDSFARYGASININAGTIALTKGNSRTWQSTFVFERPAQDQLMLSGEMDGYRIRMQLQLVGFDTFRLLNSTFRWVRPNDP